MSEKKAEKKADSKDKVVKDGSHIHGKLSGLKLLIDEIKVDHESQLGHGGGQHLVDHYFDIVNQPAQYEMAIKLVLGEFKRVMPNVIIRDYSIEHRKYKFSLRDKPFVGEIHDDCSEYTLICYYRMDSGIIGGSLKLFDDEDGNAERAHVIVKENDYVIFSGNHQVQQLHGNGSRNIFTLLVNGHF